jgi:hypothetical protein
LEAAAKKGQAAALKTDSEEMSPRSRAGGGEKSFFMV